MKRWSRRVAALLAAACALLVAAPALAAAPQCDARGAITFAPPPRLDEPNASIDLGPAADCLEKLLAADRCERGRAPAPRAATAGELAESTAAPAVPPASATALLAAPRLALPADEHRFALDRPPRG